MFLAFKNVPLFPTKEEFNVEDKLPINLAKGKFDSGIQYLDVHYRLLREDCIRPLRDVIKLYFCVFCNCERELNCWWEIRSLLI